MSTDNSFEFLVSKLVEMTQPELETPREQIHAGMIMLETMIRNQMPAGTIPNVGGVNFNDLFTPAELAENPKAADCVSQIILSLFFMMDLLPAERLVTAIAEDPDPDAIIAARAWRAAIQDLTDRGFIYQENGVCSLANKGNFYLWLFSILRTRPLGPALCYLNYKTRFIDLYDSDDDDFVHALGSDQPSAIQNNG